jgi:hypothetical protein
VNSHAASFYHPDLQHTENEDQFIGKNAEKLQKSQTANLENLGMLHVKSSAGCSKAKSSVSKVEFIERKRISQELSSLVGTGTHDKYCVEG